MHSKDRQVAVVGSGSNGLAAALELQRSGARVRFSSELKSWEDAYEPHRSPFPDFDMTWPRRCFPWGMLLPFSHSFRYIALDSGGSSQRFRSHTHTTTLKELSESLDFGVKLE